MRLTLGLLFLGIIIASSCTPTKHIVNEKRFGRLTFLSEYNFPYNKEFQNTIIGGLSGIDYDSKKNVYYIISDDRSERSPARFYKAQIVINNNKIDSVVFIETTLLKNRDGNFYPGTVNDPFHTPDPEAIRYDSLKNLFVWSSEGERIVKGNKVILENPSVTEMNDKGIYVDTLILPDQLIVSAEEKGPRRNSVFEGLSFADEYKTLFVSVEEPLYNDGSRAGLKDSTGIIRILKYDVATKKTVAQYAYKIDAVAYAPFPEDAFKINGVCDILTAGKNNLLVVERSFSTGRAGCTIKIYLADLTSAKNIEKEISIKNKGATMISKDLLLNMDDLGIYIDNIEGVCYGPVLPNGHKTLVFVSDNNFDSKQKTQFLLFEIE
ncbi:MAG: esterase-like activity of phytase family protein [Ginsengibacter sp.]